jgi:hypothetical protein
MLDLDHLDTLDDDAPPGDDLSDVRHRVGRMRARRRWAAVATGVVVLAGAVAVVAAVDQSDPAVHVAGPTVQSGVPHITARLELPKTTYPAGYSLDGTLSVVNSTGQPVDYHVDCQRMPPWKVELAKDGVRFEAPVDSVGCAQGSGTTEHLAPGENRLPFYVGLTYAGCQQQSHGLAFPACTGNPPGIPDLALGKYQLVFRGTGAPFDTLDVAPLDITVTARSDASAPLTDTLPKVGADNAPAAQDEFARLYGMEFAQYREQLRALGVDIVDYGTSGNRLVIHIKPSSREGAERDLILSLFAHPEIVTVEPGAITP